MLGLNIFNKEYPQFWKDYINSFKKEPDFFSILSLESTGSNPETDLVLAFSVTKVINNRIILKDSFEVFILHTKSKNVDLSDNFIALSQIEKNTEAEAIEKLLGYISNSIIVGHRIHQDIEMLNEILSHLKLGKIRNEIYDIEAMHNKLNGLNVTNHSLQDMANFYKINLSDRVSVADDTYAIALLFLKLKYLLKI